MMSMREDVPAPTPIATATAVGRRMRMMRLAHRAFMPTTEPHRPAIGRIADSTERTQGTTVTSAPHGKEPAITPDRRALRAFILATINATARVQPAETSDAVLTELTMTHATTLAPDVLAGFRRARVGGEDAWLAARLDGRCETRDARLSQATRE